MAELLQQRRGHFRCWALPEGRDEARRLLARDPDTLAQILTAPALPAGAAGGRARATLVGLADGVGRLRLRPVRHGGWLAPLWRGRVASPRRALRELALTAELRGRGLPVPRPLLVLAARSGPGWRAAFGSEQIDEGVDAARALAAADPGERARLAHRVGALLRLAHDDGLRHGDPHIGNFLVGPGEPGVWLVDLDRARLGAPPGRRTRQRQLARLRRSLRKHGLADALGAVRAGYAAEP